MKKLLLLALLGFGGYQAYQHYFFRPYIGEWMVDMDQYLAKYPIQNITDAQKQVIEKIQKSNIMTITKEQVTLNITGESLVLPYREVSHTDNCYAFEVSRNGETGTMNACVDSGKLTFDMRSGRGQIETQHFVKLTKD